MPGSHYKSYNQLSPSEVISLLNIRTGKVIAVALVIIFVFAHLLFSKLTSILGDTIQHEDDCRGLLGDGVFQRGVWRVRGCCLHKHGLIDSLVCSRKREVRRKGNNIVFIGGSVMEQIANALQASLTLNTTISGGFHSEDRSRQAEKFDVMYLTNSVFSAEAAMLFNEWRKPSTKSPSLLIVGEQTDSFILDYQDPEVAESEFEKKLVLLEKVFRRLRRKPGTQVLWMLDPYARHDDPERNIYKATATLNDVARSVFASSPVEVWSSVSSICKHSETMCTDGKLSSLALKTLTLILSNYFCNADLPLHVGTCCKPFVDLNGVQIVLLSGVVVITVIVTADFFHREYQRRSKKADPDCHPLDLLIFRERSNTSNEGNDSRAFLHTLMRLGLILAYVFVCDKTNLFMKENKFFGPTNFYMPLLYIAILGLFFNERVADKRVLNTEQLDEWNGWMTLFVIIYNSTEAQELVPIYVMIHLLVSSFLFILGFSHFMSFWSGTSKTLSSFVEPLFRFNFCTLLLSLVMDTNYQTYFLVPLFTFWYLVEVVILKLPPEVHAASVEANDRYFFYLAIKIIVFMGLVSVLYMSEFVFETMFLLYPWRALYVNADGQIDDWWFHWRLHRYSMLSGFVLGFFTVVARRFKLIDDDNEKSLWSNGVSGLMCFGAVIGMLSFVVFALNCTAKEVCNEVHPYISFVPIISFVLLRNVVGVLRSRYSSFFAWFGEISTELFLVHLHGLLAVDKMGMLVVIPNFPALNTIVVTLIFVCIAHELHMITNNLVRYVVPSEEKCLGRMGVVILALVFVFAFVRHSGVR